MNTSTPTDKTESQRYAEFTAKLREWGFSVFQVALVQDALRESGLRLEVDPDRQ